MKNSVINYLFKLLSIFSVFLFGACSDVFYDSDKSPEIKIEKVEFSVTAGDVRKGTELTLSSKTENAIIYYTKDGKTPDSKSLKYESSLIIDSDMIVKAVAILKDTSSEVTSAAYNIATAEAVTFSVPSGGILKNSTVKLSTKTSDCEIYYTTDGTEPDSSKTKFTSDIIVTENVTIKAIAVSPYYKNSKVSSVSYEIGKVSTVVFSVVSSEVTIETELTLSTATDGASIYYTTDGTIPDSSSILYTGPVKIVSAGTYTAIAIKDGYENSNTSSETYSLEPIQSPTYSFGLTDALYLTASISCSTPGAVIHYKNGSKATAADPVFTDPITIYGPTTLYYYITREGLADISGYKNLSGCSKVKSNVTTGSSVLRGTKINLTCDTKNSRIYYALDGFPPDIKSPLYSEPIEITEATTITAKSVNVISGRPNNGMSTFNYTITQTPEVTASIDTGNVDYLSNVKLSCSSEDAKIYYTTDGSTPTTSSSVYSSGITISDSITLKAFALIDDRYDPSAVKTWNYYIETVKEPEISLPDGTYNGDDSVTITADDGCKTTCYLYNANTDEYITSYQSSSNVYTLNFTDIQIDKIRLKVFAYKTGAKPSEYVYSNYLIERPAAPVYHIINPTTNSFEIVLDSSSGDTYFTFDNSTPKQGEGTTVLYTPGLSYVKPDSQQNVIIKAVCKTTCYSAVTKLTISPVDIYSNTKIGNELSENGKGVITLRTKPNDAEIFYTLDGSDPSLPGALSLAQNGSFDIENNTTLKILAKSSTSFITTEEMIYKAQVAGCLHSTRQITGKNPLFKFELSTGALPTQKIYYTTNGSTPNTGSTLWDGDYFYLNQEDGTVNGKTIEFKINKLSVDPSGVYGNSYQIFIVTFDICETPVITKLGETSLFILNYDSDYDFYYTDDNTDPRTSATRQSAYRVIDSEAGKTIRLIATKYSANIMDSKEVSMSF